MSFFEFWFVVATVVAFVVFAAVLAWGWYRTKDGPQP
jgi:hypothetical protein